MSDRDIEEIVNQESANLINEIAEKVIMGRTTDLEKSEWQASLEQRVKVAFRLAIYRSLCSFQVGIFQRTLEQLNKERD
jgi:hypothetical protein